MATATLLSAHNSSLGASRTSEGGGPSRDWKDGCKRELDAALELDPVAAHLHLRELQASKPHLFYHLLLNDTEDLLPLIYTPTVGEICQRYHELPIKTRGLYLRASDRGNLLGKLRAWGQPDVAVAVVTDGERILGLGDQGAGGMGISEGKILLYTAAAGVSPDHCLPVCLDIGTNNEDLLADPDYQGVREQRLTGEAYYSFLEEFIQAIKDWRPHLVLQFEDFGNHTAFELLHTYRRQLCCFNDDIQGTASICLSGLLSSLRKTGSDLGEQKILFLGAGEAGVGIGELIAQAIATRTGRPLVQARQQCCFMDSKGLITASREGLQDHKLTFAHDLPEERDLEAAIRSLRPTVLIGVSTVRGAFTQAVLGAMADVNELPIIFPLSNPTSKAECTYEEALQATGGRLMFASGSPFKPVQHEGATMHPAQANNAYIFPAVGHAAMLTRCSAITDEAFLAAAESLAHQSTMEELAVGRLFPAFKHIKEVSLTIMADVMRFFVDHGLGTKPDACVGDNYLAYARSQFWTPEAGMVEHQCKL